jgi:hypothetical protein
LIYFYITITHSSSSSITHTTTAAYKTLCDKNSRIQKKLEERLEALQKKKKWLKANAFAVFPDTNGD